jgi:precorrin-2 dehydrogenase / sirohydrochlorin ferrochelatase
MSLFPMFVKLAGRPCLVVGAGTVAESKIEGLLQADAAVRVVAPRVGQRANDWAQAGRISLEEREFLPRDLDGAFLVIAATSSPGLNALVFEQARSRNVLCNVVDDPAHCDFYYPAVVRRGKLQLAISTEGQSPALAQKLRKELEAQFGPEYEGWVEKLGEARRQLFTTELEAEERRAKLHELASNGPPGQSTQEGVNAR